MFAPTDTADGTRNKKKRRTRDDDVDAATTADAASAATADDDLQIRLAAANQLIAELREKVKASSSDNAPKRRKIINEAEGGTPNALAMMSPVSMNTAAAAPRPDSLATVCTPGSKAAWDFNLYKRQHGILNDKSRRHKDAMKEEERMVKRDEQLRDQLEFNRMKNSKEHTKVEAVQAVLQEAQRKLDKTSVDIEKGEQDLEESVTLIIAAKTEVAEAATKLISQRRTVAGLQLRIITREVGGEVRLLSSHGGNGAQDIFLHALCRRLSIQDEG